VEKEGGEGLGIERIGEVGRGGHGGVGKQGGVPGLGEGVRRERGVVVCGEGRGSSIYSRGERGSRRVPKHLDARPWR
jgi:hypothetical protein